MYDLIKVYPAFKITEKTNTEKRAIVYYVLFQYMTKFGEKYGK